MAAVMSLEEISARLLALEKLVASFLRRKSTPPAHVLPPNGHDFVYVLTLDDKEIWRGHDLETQLIEVTRGNPGRLVTISWEYMPDVLVI